MRLRCSVWFLCQWWLNEFFHVMPGFDGIFLAGSGPGVSKAMSDKNPAYFVTRVL